MYILFRTSSISLPQYYLGKLFLLLITGSVLNAQFFSNILHQIQHFFSLMALLESITNHFAGGLPSGQRRLASLGDLGERPRGQIIPSLVSELGHWQAVAAFTRILFLQTVRLFYASLPPSIENQFA